MRVAPGGWKTFVVLVAALSGVLGFGARAAASDGARAFYEVPRECPGDVRREVGQGDGFEGEVSPLPDAEQLLIEKRWRELLDRVLAELSDTHRTLFVLFELEGFSAPDIAQLLELPLGTVSSRLWRARARFSEIAAQLHSSMKEAP